MKKFNQNALTTVDVKIGADKFGIPIYKKMKVETTNKSVIIWKNPFEIYGECRIKDEKDFDYDKMLSIALERSGSKIKVA